jgi:isochorismate hydrolase
VQGFEVFLVADATATYNHDFHLSSLKNLSHGFAHPVLTEDILAVSEPKDET